MFRTVPKVAKELKQSTKEQRQTIEVLSIEDRMSYKELLGLCSLVIGKAISDTGKLTWTQAQKIIKRMRRK